MGCKPCCHKPISNQRDSIEFKLYINHDNIKYPFKESINSEYITKENINNYLIKDENNLKLNENDDNYNIEILVQINNYRKRHNVDILMINNEINILAKKHSDKIAREKYLELSNNKYNNIELGEIIFCVKENNSAENIISSFYEEEALKYNYNNINPKPSHFTQIIWKNSKYIGIGSTKTKDNNIYIVIDFYPPGNIPNEFISNVLPPINEEIKSNISSSNSERKIYFLEELFNRNNEYREKHGVPSLTLNPALTTKADNYSNFIAEQRNLIDYEIEYLGQKCGKNIFIKKIENYDGNEICDEWYNEVKDYDFVDEKKNNLEKFKNFTQMIWKGTKEVGFGWSKSKEGILYIIGIYYPAGNIKGKYQENVFPEIE